MPKLNAIQLEACARAGYEAMISTCRVTTTGGELPHWNKLTKIARQDYMDDAADYLSGMTIEQIHEKQLGIMKELGWSYGPVKDEEKKQSPDIVTWDKLSFFHRSNDYIVFEIIKAMARIFEELNSPAWGAIQPNE